MSLLEDVFLENEAGEAQELERIIEGDEFDERPRSRSDSGGNSAKEDEAEEDKKRVDPTSAKPKRVIKNPRFVLNPARLTGPRGIKIVPEHFKDFKFRGKGHERDDLDLVLKKLEHWAYRLYPKFQFQDCLKKIETLGKKRPVSVQLTKIRLDLITSDDTVVQRDSSDDEAAPIPEPEDEFDKLLQQQIDIARATPAPGSANKAMGSANKAAGSVNETAGSISKPPTERSSAMPKGISSPSINDEQRDRMLRSRKMAEERRIARLKQNTSQESTTENNLARSPTKIVDLSAEEKHSTIIDSSDEDVEINKSVTNDISKTSDIELYTDGTVVTKSPKCYVPAKKHNKYIMNHAEEYVTVDIHDRNKHDTVELDNDGLVVTKTSKNSLFTIKPNKSIIDGADDDDALVISKPVDVENHRSDIVTAKKHNKNKIDSSDDDDALVISETVTIDVEKHNHDGSKSKNVTNRKHKFNIEDNSDDDDHVVNEPITIDVENHHNDDGDDGDDHHTAKKHKSNIVDSSDSDDDTAVINESITVDVYDSEKPLTSNVDSVFDNLGKTNAGDNDVIMNKGSEYFVIQADEQNKTNSSVLNDSVGHSVNDR